MIGSWGGICERIKGISGSIAGSKFLNQISKQIHIFHDWVGCMELRYGLKMINLEQSFARCSNLDTSESRLEISKMFLKGGDGEGWRSVGTIVWEMKKYYKESRKTGISYRQQKE